MTSSGDEADDGSSSPVVLRPKAALTVNSIDSTSTNHGCSQQAAPTNAVCCKRAASVAKVARYSARNRRHRMEDRSALIDDLSVSLEPPASDWCSSSLSRDVVPILPSVSVDRWPCVFGYYAVFDGHSGTLAATYCAANMHRHLAASPSFPARPEQALCDAFHTTDRLFGEQNERAGSTAVVALLGSDTMHVAWAGDCLAVLSRRRQPAISLVHPHRPDRSDERARVERLGGVVQEFERVARVQGMMAVARSVGDAAMKPFITAEPDVTEVRLDGSEQLLLLASDGLWDEVTPQEAVDFVLERLQQEQQVCADREVDDSTDTGMAPSKSNGVVEKSAEERVLCELGKLAIDRGSSDNISIVCVWFREETVVSDSTDGPAIAGTILSTDNIVSPHVLHVDEWPGDYQKLPNGDPGANIDVSDTDEKLEPFDIHGAVARALSDARSASVTLEADSGGAVGCLQNMSFPVGSDDVLGVGDGSMEAASECVLDQVDGLAETELVVDAEDSSSSDDGGHWSYVPSSEQQCATASSVSPPIAGVSSSLDNIDSPIVSVGDRSPAGLNPFAAPFVPSNNASGNNKTFDAGGLLDSSIGGTICDQLSALSLLDQNTQQQVENEPVSVNPIEVVTECTPSSIESDTDPQQTVQADESSNVDPINDKSTTCSSLVSAATPLSVAAVSSSIGDCSASGDPFLPDICPRAPDTTDTVDEAVLEAATPSVQFVDVSGPAAITVTNTTTVDADSDGNVGSVDQFVVVTEAEIAAVRNELIDPGESTVSSTATGVRGTAESVKKVETVSKMDKKFTGSGAVSSKSAISKKADVTSKNNSSKLLKQSVKPSSGVRAKTVGVSNKTTGSSKSSQPPPSLSKPAPATSKVSNTKSNVAGTVTSSSFAARKPIPPSATAKSSSVASRSSNRAATAGRPTTSSTNASAPSSRSVTATTVKRSGVARTTGATASLPSTGGTSTARATTRPAVTKSTSERSAIAASNKPSTTARATTRSAPATRPASSNRVVPPPTNRPASSSKVVPPPPATRRATPTTAAKTHSDAKARTAAGARADRVVKQAPLQSKTALRPPPAAPRAVSATSRQTAKPAATRPETTSRTVGVAKKNGAVSNRCAPALGRDVERSKQSVKNTTGSVPTTASSVSASQSPVSPAPVIQSPISPAPIESPVSSAPVIQSPVSPAPIESPVSPAPIESPVSSAPGEVHVSPAHVIQSPISPAPIESPVSSDPVIQSPISPAPIESPVSSAPVIQSPVSPAPVESPVSSALIDFPVYSAPVEIPVSHPPIIQSPVCSASTQSPVSPAIIGCPLSTPPITPGSPVQQYDVKSTENDCIPIDTSTEVGQLLSSVHTNGSECIDEKIGSVIGISVGNGDNIVSGASNFVETGSSQEVNGSN